MTAVKKHRLTTHPWTMAACGVAMLMASAAASAQSSVTVFGQIAVGLTKASNTPMQVATTGWGNGIGFKGTEDMGGGLSAFFHLENRFDVDTGTAATPFWTEKAALGLSGGFGRLQFGRFGNAFDDIKSMGDPFGETVANIGNEAALGETRWDNSIGYYTPELNGFSGAVTLATKEGMNIRVPYALGLKYAYGPMAASIGFVKNGLNDVSTVILSGNYSIGAAKLYASYSNSSNTGMSDARNAQVGVSVVVSPAGTVKAAFSNYRDASLTSDRTNKVGLGYWHTLSKRTMLYTDVARTSTKAAGVSTNVNAFDIGIFHTF